MPAAFALRFVVFVDEQQVPEDEELDEHDATAVHAGGFDGNRLVATGRLVVLPDGVGKVGRMAVAADARGRGLGAGVLGRLEQTAREQGIGEVVLGAQLSAVAFYERSGYAAYGDVFDDAGIDHLMMRKRLDRSSTGSGRDQEE